MKTSFKKTLIAASAGAALAAASLVAQAGTPGTTNLLFPYVTTATGSYTFISIAARGGAGPANAHFTYATKPIAAGNSAACDHINGDAKLTSNDLMQFEIQKKVDMAGAFGDTTSVPKYFPFGGVANDRHGMLIVNNDTAANGSYGTATAYLNAPLYGEARIISTAAGLAMGYSTDDLHSAGALRPDFAAATGPDAGGAVKIISWFPSPAVSTSWFVEPLDNETNMAFAGNATQVYGVYNDGLQNAAGVWAAPTGALGHFNNNEAFQSSAATTSVTCLGVVSRDTLLGALSAPWSVNGGWGVFMQSAAPVPASATGSLVYKMEGTGALGGTQSFVTREPLL